MAESPGRRKIRSEARRLGLQIQSIRWTPHHPVEGRTEGAGGWVVQTNNGMASGGTLDAVLNNLRMGVS